MALGWYELGLDGTREGSWKWLRNWAWDFEKNLILTLESRFKRHFNTNLEISDPKLQLYSLSHPIFSLLFWQGAISINRRRSRIVMLRYTSWWCVTQHDVVLPSLSSSTAWFFSNLPLLCSNFDSFVHCFRDEFWRSSWGQIESNLVSIEILRCLLSNSTDFMRFGVLSSKLRLSEAKVFKLSFTMSLVFPVKSPTKPEILSVNWDTLLVDEFTIFDKFSYFQTTLEQIGKILRAKVASWVGKLSNFSAFWIYFRHFSCFSWPNFRCRISMILVFPESSWYLLSNDMKFLGIQAQTSKLNPW